MHRVWPENTHTHTLSVYAPPEITRLCIYDSQCLIFPVNNLRLCRCLCRNKPREKQQNLPDGAFHFSVCHTRALFHHKSQDVQPADGFPAAPINRLEHLKTVEPFGPAEELLSAGTFKSLLRYKCRPLCPL